MEKILLVFDCMFDFIWKIQKCIMKFKITVEKMEDTWLYKAIEKFFSVTYLISFALTVFSLFFIKNQILLNISIIVFLVSLFITTYLKDTLKAFLSPFTSIRYFFLISVAFNLLLFSILLERSSIMATILSIFIFLAISLISNTEISITANTIIEITLAVLVATKDYLSTLFPHFCRNLIDKCINNATMDIATSDIAEATEYINHIKEETLIQIDNILFPLLLINGFALLLCAIHSYWIKKYNYDKQITWDKKLINKYINQ